jgi:hypothetical protein
MSKTAKALRSIHKAAGPLCWVPTVPRSATGGGPASPPCRLPGAFDATCSFGDASPQVLSVRDTLGTGSETALQGETLGYPHNVQVPDKPSDPSFGEDSFSLCSASHCPSISVLARPVDTERATASSVLPTFPFPFFPSPVIWNSQHFTEQTTWAHTAMRRCHWHCSFYFSSLC